ncbi:MAG: leucine-rich repeat domain-containing protein [Clostridia bacterium]|nr:leucine-rich repeat domain-containing protein [Clostridia bacterium]
MRSKRIAAIVLAVGMVGSLGLTACGGKKGGVKGEKLTDEAAWVQALEDTASTMNATIRFEISQEAHLNELSMTEAGSGVLEIADGKAYRFLEGRSTGCYEDEGKIIPVDEPITIEEYIVEQDGVMVEWTKQNDEEWEIEIDCGVNAILGDVTEYYFNIPFIQSFMSMYSQFEFNDGIYTYIMEMDRASAWVQLKYVDGRLYSCDYEYTYRTIEEEGELVRTDCVYFVISYGDASIGMLPWEEDSSEGNEEGGEEVVQPKPASEGLEFEYINGANAYAVSDIGTCEDTEIVIPAQYNEYPVTQVRYDAFANCNNITKVVIPEGVTVIGERAFQECKNLVEVVIPSTVTRIDAQAFMYCKQLSQVTIPSGVTVIDIQTFWFCSVLEEIVIPETVTTIKESAFSDCEQLEKATIGSNVTKIEDYAFSGCENLREIKFNGTVAQWEAIWRNDELWNRRVPAKQIVCADGNYQY